MGKLSLSKSSYVRGLKCLKSLYLYKHHYNWKEKPDDAQQALFDTGHQVGELAQKLFPGGIEVIREKPWEYKKAAEQTKALLDSGTSIIYEASFVYNDIFIALDILLNKDGKWYGYEVKATKSVKDYHLDDAAVQYYVLKNCGITLEDISITHLRKGYVRQGDLDYNSLFLSESVYQEVLDRQNEIEQNVNEQRTTLKKTNIPDIDIGPHCYQNYPCDYCTHCWKHIPQPSVFDLYSIRSPKQYDLYYDGHLGFEDIPSDFKLSQFQEMQVDSYLNNKLVINKEGINEFIDDLKYPLYFMDFETIAPAVPMFDSSESYLPVPFQYSVHLKKDKNSKETHWEYLAEANGDPRREFTDKLLADLGDEGDILVFNQGFENTRLKELAELFPEYANEINKIKSRVKDLLVPFKKGFYYDPKFGGSLSMKSILPVMCPELPKYEEMAIGDGGTASKSFENLYFQEDTTVIEETRTNLRKYCKVDTLGMVRILEKLAQF